MLLLRAQALLDAGHPSTLSDLLVDQLRAIDNRPLVEGPLTRLPRRVDSSPATSITSWHTMSGENSPSL